jgi:hypothetical protein
MASGLWNYKEALTPAKGSLLVMWAFTQLNTKE